MPKGPKGEKRPADVIGAAVLVGKIATGEEKDSHKIKGKKGGHKRAEKLSSEKRTEIARKAANTRWGAGAAPVQEEISEKQDQ